MPGFAISDWDDAYANSAHIASGNAYPDRWAAAAAAFRDEALRNGRAELDIAYGDGGRCLYDLFLPQGEAFGAAIYIHGGYWMSFDKSWWSHLAAGALARGWAVALPQYSLCPDVSIAQITAEIGQAVTAVAARVGGHLRIAGHSAGGHLAARMVCRDSPLAADTLARIGHTLSISGVHDLRPLLRTKLNDTLRLDETQAVAESPALHRPVENARITCWVGGGERSEFLRQNALLANVWRGLGARTECIEEPDRHHFSVVEGLADADSPITRCWLG